MINEVVGVKDNDVRMVMVENLIDCLMLFEEVFQKSSKGGYLFGGENIGFFDIVCGVMVGLFFVVEVFLGVKFLNEDIILGMFQWVEKFRVYEVVEFYLLIVVEFFEFVKKKFNVQ